MSELPQIFLSAQQEFSARVHAVTESQWSGPTPDTEWTVTDLVDHLIDEHKWFPPLLRGHDLDAAGKIVAGSSGGDDPDRASQWDYAAVQSADAVREPDALDRSVELSRGATPAKQYALEMTMDLIIHAWDLGAAIGYAEPLPADLADFGYEQAKGWGDISDSGYFGKPVPVRDDASSLAKLVALTGRDPNWTP
jgi:uncharacterized protein (TIGR03086 family)